MSRQKRRHRKSLRSLTLSSASMSRSGCVSHQGILSTPFRSMTIGPPIFEIQFDLQNSRSKTKVKGTPVSAVSRWLISLVFHIRASYRLPSLSFYAWQSGLPFRRCSLTLKIQCQRSRSKVSFLYHINWTNGNHSYDMANRMFNCRKTDSKFKKKMAKQMFLTKFLPNLIR